MGTPHIPYLCDKSRHLISRTRVSRVLGVESLNHTIFLGQAHAFTIHQKNSRVKKNTKFVTLICSTRALHIAAYGGHEAVTEKLLAIRCNVDLQLKGGCTTREKKNSRACLLGDEDIRRSTCLQHLKVALSSEYAKEQVKTSQ